MAILPQKILVIRFSSIGDIVLTSPVVRILRKNYPEAEIHFITKANFVEQLLNHPELFKIWSFEKSFKEVIQDLKRCQFDLVVDLHKNLRSYLLTLQLGQTTIRFSKLTFKKFLYTQFKINWLPTIHLVDRYLNALKKNGLEVDEEGLEYFLNEKSIKEAEKLLLNLEGKFIAVALGAAHFTKSPPELLWKNILTKSPIPVVLLGGNKEISLSLQLEKFLAESELKVINTVGKVDINITAALVAKSALVICPDTGIMHIAAAFHKPIVSIWGNTTRSFGMWPYYGRHEPPSFISEVTELSCRPCSKIGYSACPKKHFNCMNKINHDEITSWYLKTLSFSD